MSKDALHITASRWEAARQAEREARAEMIAAIKEARKTQTLAEIAKELGISRQRVEQLSR